MLGKMYMLAIVVSMSMATGCSPLQTIGCHTTTATSNCNFGRFNILN